MATVADKVMFEIYREAGYDRRYRIVYFTELNEHNKDLEIDRALMGEHFCDGFLSDSCKARAKRELAEMVDRLNAGEAVTCRDVEQAIAQIEAFREC